MKIKTMGLALAAASLGCGLSARAATIVDLTTTAASGTANGAFFQQISPQTTGTGVIDPFLRIQANGTEEGFNNNVSLPTLDDVNQGGQNYNHDIQLSHVPVVNISGVNYYQFLVDINQNKGNDGELLSLDKLEIWLKPTAITSFAGSKGLYTDLSGSGAVKKYDLDGAGDAFIKLNFLLNPGSGAGDMFANIPVDALGTDGSQFVYLYSMFGSNFASNDGFEEWATLQGDSTSVPDGGTTVMLLGSALSAIALIRRKVS